MNSVPSARLPTLQELDRHQARGDIQQAAHAAVEVLKSSEHPGAGEGSFQQPPTPLVVNRGVGDPAPCDQNAIALDSTQPNASGCYRSAEHAATTPSDAIAHETFHCILREMNAALLLEATEAGLATTLLTTVRTA